MLILTRVGSQSIGLEVPGHTDPDRNQSAFQQAIQLLDRLHRPKDRAYGDAWRKRGEVLGIFANIARKVDRLSLARAEVRMETTENLLDTVADLAVYSGKYLTWLAEVQPVPFETVPPSPLPDECKAARGPEALFRVLNELPRWENAQVAMPPTDVNEALDRTNQTFAALESALVSQAEQRTEATLSWAAKVEIAWALADASTWLFVRLGQSQPSLLTSFSREVARLEGISD